MHSIFASSEIARKQFRPTGELISRLSEIKLLQFSPNIREICY